MSRQKEIIRQSGAYSVSTLLTQLITIGAAFLTRLFLGPTQMGIWSTLQIIVDYSKYAALGTMSAVSVEIPYWMGKGNSDHAEKIKDTAFTFVVISTLVFCGAIAAFALLTQGRFPAEVTFGLFFVSAIIFLQRINNLLIALLRCYKKFHIESGQMIWSALVNAALIALLASRFKIYGFIWALGLSFVFNIIYLARKYRYSFRWFFNKQVFQPLMARGFPLMLLGIMSAGLQNIDRMVIAKMQGFEALGFYSIALMTCSFISNFLSADNTVLVPHFQEKFGEKDNLNDLRDFLFNSSLPFILIMPVFIVCAWSIVPYFIQFFLPKFIPGISAMKILVLSMFFVPLINQYQGFLVTVKKQILIFPILACSIVLASGLSWFAIHRQNGIEGVAFVMTLVSFISFTLCYFTAARLFANAKDSLKRFLILLSSFVYLVLFLFLEGRFVSSPSYGIFRVFTECVWALLFCMPLLLILNARFSFFEHLLKRGKEHDGTGAPPPGKKTSKLI